MSIEAFLSFSSRRQNVKKNLKESNEDFHIEPQTNTGNLACQKTVLVYSIHNSALAVS